MADIVEQKHMLASQARAVAEHLLPWVSADPAARQRSYLSEDWRAAA